MKPLEMSARFDAFIWYINNRRAPKPTLQAEAKRFSQENWQAFLPVAHEGLGRLLLRIARVRPQSSHLLPTESRCKKRHLAAAG